MTSSNKLPNENYYEYFTRIQAENRELFNKLEKEESECCSGLNINIDFISPINVKKVIDNKRHQLIKRNICSECGSDNIIKHAWIDPNSDNELICTKLCEDDYEEFFCNDCKTFCDGREMKIREDDEVIGFHVIEDDDDDYILPLGFNMEDVFCLSQALYFIHEFLPKKYRIQTVWKYDIDDYGLRFHGDCRD